jgi:hypothetical protein
MAKLRTIGQETKMKTNAHLALMLLLLIGGSLYASVPAANTPESSVREKPANLFVGTWAPAPSDGQQVFIASLQINEDKTFVAKFSNSRPEMKGTYAIKDNKLLFESEELKKHGEDLSATITEDGRLKLTKGTDQEHSLYFVKK